MDLDIWRKDNISEKMISYFVQNKDSDKLNKLPDQDLISIVLKNRVTELPQKWNNLCGPSLANTSPSLKGLHHYLSGIKPWHFPKTYKKSYNLYYDYWYKSPFKKYKHYYYLKSIDKIYLANLYQIYCSIVVNLYILKNNNLCPYYVKCYR